jgi:hypothetical protein
VEVEPQGTALFLWSRSLKEPNCFVGGGVARYRIILVEPEPQGVTLLWCSRSFKELHYFEGANATRNCIILWSRSRKELHYFVEPEPQGTALFCGAGDTRLDMLVLVERF